MDRIYGHGTKLGMITFSQIIDLVLKITWFTFISQFRCFVGKRHLEEAMKAFSNNLHFEVTWKPFFLNPTTPDTGVPLDQYLTRKYGPKVAAQAKEGTSPLSRAGMNVVITCTIVIDIIYSSWLYYSVLAGLREYLKYWVVMICGWDSKILINLVGWDDAMEALILWPCSRHSFQMSSLF